ncbi:hypothetical protein J2T57_003883 [Natronocella acetinitrilica]|uniref:DUF349 domain-containing protein n=1 Tax=Natronocella acetinitrilica TaxID=414046 RepID=A0AAE3G776_9GAMM|nr:DUF349 domain-containing protein [Natronocella acetinitrilica]MCP1676712.1 hypothetical protein [Natronocella acetinitrilica]
MILKRILKSRRGADKAATGGDSQSSAASAASGSVTVDLDALATAAPDSREADQFREILAAGAPGITLETRLTCIDASLDPTLLAHLARSGRELEIRLAALEHVVGDRLLEEIALHDRVTRVRQLAVARLTSEDGLERVFQASRGQDARVAREARQRLDEIAAARAEQEAVLDQRRQLCTEAEAISAGERSGPLGALLDRLENRWGGLVGVPPDDLANRFRAAVTAGRALAEQQSQAHYSPAAIGEVLTTLSALDDAALTERLTELDRTLAELPEASAASPNPAELEALAAPLQQWREDLRAWHAHRGTVQALLAELQSNPGDVERERRLAGLLAEVPWRTSRSKPAQLRDAERWLSGERSGTAPPGKSPGPPEGGDAHGARPDEMQRQQQAFDTQYQQVSDALDDGDLRRARRLLGRMHKRVEQLPRKARAPFEERLKPLAVRVQELQDWRRFAVLPKQETLCRRMEEIAGTPLEPQEQYDAIQGMREEWKALGGSDSRESRALWERFQKAADTAFEPCRVWFHALHAQREANLEERQRICDQLDTFLQSRPLDELDSKALDEIYGVAREAWRAASPVDPQRGRQAKRRFRRAMDAISEELKRRRGGLREEKKRLLEAAHALETMEDLHGAIREAKRLQQIWRDLGPLPPGEERRRHRELQQACDKVFGRLRGERQHQEQQHTEEQQQVEAQAAALQKILEENGEEAQIKQALQELVSAHGRAADIVRRRLSREVDELRRDARLALAAWQRRRWEDGLNALRDAATKVRAAERAVEGDGELPSAPPGMHGLPEGCVENLQARWQTAVAMQRDANRYEPARLESAAEQRQRLCVRMEILAGVDSPDADRDLRMSLQVERLSASLGGGEHDDPTQSLERLAHEWYALGPWPADASGQMEQRFWQALSRAMEH